MKTQSPTLTVCAILSASCLVWVGGISLALVYLFEVPSHIGWIIAGSLGLTTAVSVAVIAWELRHAIDLTGYVDPGEFNGLQPSKRWNLRSYPTGKQTLRPSGGAC